MTADFGPRRSRRDEDEPITIPGLHRATFLHDGADLTVELWFREVDELRKFAIPWLKTTDMHAIRRFIEHMNVLTEIIDNS